MTLLFEHWPASVPATIEPGQLIVGGSASLTVTVKSHLLLLPAKSVAVQITVELPLGKVEFDGGVQLILTARSQLSVALTVYARLLFEH